MNFTDEDVIKAVDICLSIDQDCVDCPFSEYGDCERVARECLQDIFNRQKAEIERLMQKLQQPQAEAIKEFANLIKRQLNCNTPRGAYLLDIVDNLVKERVGD